MCFALSSVHHRLAESFPATLFQQQQQQQEQQPKAARLGLETRGQRSPLANEGIVGRREFS